MDADIFDALAHRPLSRTDLFDLFPDRPYHVRLVGDTLRHRVRAVLIDLERDGTWEERWDLDDTTVTRRVLQRPAGPGAGTPFALRSGRWLPF